MTIQQMAVEGGVERLDGGALAANDLSAVPEMPIGRRRRMRSWAMERLQV